MKSMSDRLIEYFSQEKKVTGVQLHVVHGKESRKLLEGCPGLILNCVDPWEQRVDRRQETPVSREKWVELYTEAKGRLAVFDARCKIIKGFFDEASYSFRDDSLDFVFFNSICNSEDEMKKNILLWIPKVTDGGIVCGVLWKNALYKESLDYFSNKMDFCQFDDGSWILSPVDEETRVWAMLESKREGDWNEHGYFESIRPDTREFWKKD